MKKLYFLLIACIVSLCANAQLYVCGAGDGLAWTPESPYVVTADAEGNYTFTIKNLSSFKMSTAKGSWTVFNSGAIGSNLSLAADTEYNISAYGENQVLPWEGDWTVKVYANNTKMYLTTTTPNPGAATIYIRGGMNGWGSSNEWKFSTTDGVQYELKGVTISANVDFKIGDSSWGKVNYGGAPAIQPNKEYTLSYNSNTNCKLAADFTGDVRFNLDTHVVIFDDGSAVDPDVPSYKDVYLVGDNYGPWGPSAEYKMNTEDGIVYTLKLPSLTGAWKINDGTWDWSWGKGSDEPELNKPCDVWYNSSVNFSLNVDHEVTIKLTIADGSAASGSSIPSTLVVYDANYDPDAPVVNPTYTVYFDNTNAQWETVYAYMWNGEKNNAAWPGEAMTKGENNIWSYSIQSPWEPASVIFNDGKAEGAQQTADLVFENEKTYDTPAPVAYNVSFDNGLTAWETVYAYVFDAEGNSFVAAWPGVEMTKGEGTVYTYDFKAVFTPATVIFNDGKAEGAQQTDNLAFENGKVYGDPAPVVVENVLVKWDNTTAAYEAPYANWAIEKDGEYVAVAMTEIMEEVETPDVPEQPEAKVVTYNFSDFTAGDFTEETKVGDLTVYATASGKITVDASAKTIDGVAYTQRLKFGGTGNVKNGTPSRVIGFPVDGPCTITAAATSSNGTEDRTLNVFAADGSVLGTIAAPAGTIAVGSYAYTGEAATLYLGSAKSGLNIYFVKVEYPAAEANALAIEYVGTGIWQAELPQEAKYVYFTDGPADRGTNKLFAVEHEKTYSPETEGVTGVESVAVDANAPAVYYNLQGVRVANPEAGQVYIMVQGNKTAKVIK